MEPAVLAALVALPAVVVAVTMVGSGWRPVGLDLSLELLRTWEVGGRHTPLVGAYSRYGWDHPGPLLFVVSAPAVRLLGPEGLVVTAGVVNALAAAGAVVAAHRIAGLSLAVPTAIVTAVMMHAVTGAGLVDPWNPYVALLPFLAYLLCLWGAVEGDHWLLVGAVVAGSWSVQAHLGYLPVTAGAAVIGCGLHVGLRRGRAEVWRLPRWWIMAAAVVGLVLWLPPLVGQLATPDANVHDLYDFARYGSNPAGLVTHPVGWTPALDAMTGMVTPDAPWTQRAWPNAYLKVPKGSLATALPFVGALVALGGLAWWRGRRRPAALVGLATALLPLSVVAMAHTTDDLLGYLIRWTWAVAALGWIAAASAVLELLDLRRRPAWLLAVVGLAGCVVVGVLGLRTVTDGSTSDPRGKATMHLVERMSDQLRTRLDPDATYELVADSNWRYLVAPGIAVDLITHGQHLVVTHDLAPSFKDWWAADPRKHYPRVVIMPVTDVADWRRDHPGARRVAVSTPRTEAEQREPVVGVPQEAWLVPLPARDGSSRSGLIRFDPS